MSGAEGSTAATTTAATTTAAAVDAVIRAGGPGLAVLMEQVEQGLARLGTDHGATLARHATATIAAGGKRLRPLLVFIAAGDAAPTGAAAGRLVRGAIAVELIHSASLVHDDVLDAAPLRRGAPTVVAAAGHAVAIATGDLLFSRAFAQLAAGGELADVRALSAAASALAAGELLQRADAWDASVPLERYLQRCELKTGSLFEAACRLGALASGGPADALGLFGRRIGLAFQLLDDVLDVSGPATRTGKRRGTDLLDGTVTLPLILARERDASLSQLDVRVLRTAAAAEEVCERIAATGALAAAKQQALAVVELAREELPEGLPTRQRAALELVAEGVVERYA